MPDSTKPDYTDTIAALRAEHEDDRAYVDALFAFFQDLSAAQVRNAVAIADEILRVSREIGYERGEALGLLALGFERYLWQQNQEAFTLILEARHRLEGQRGADEAKARCATLLSGLHMSMGSYQKALEFGHEALALVEGTQFSQGNGWPHYMLGDTYRALRDLDRARQHYQNAFNVFSELNDPAGISRALIGLGSVYRDQGDYDSSEQHFTKARRIRFRT